MVAYLGLGSNIGDRTANLRLAVQKLIDVGVKVVAISSIYETEPVGKILQQDDFYNAAVKVSTDLGPERLLTVCKGVERELGRDFSAARHSPRPIDIDLLLMGDTVYSSERLELPHPEVTTRRFVLVPLLELEPELVTPTGLPLAACLQELGSGQRVRKIAEELATTTGK